MLENIKSNFEKFFLYILSLWLLFFLLIIVTFEPVKLFNSLTFFENFKAIISKNYISFVSLLFMMSGAYPLWQLKHKTRGATTTYFKISKKEDINFEHLTFLTTYIIPLICFNLKDERYLIALAFLLIIIGVIYIRTDRFFANPTLAVLGFRIYRVDLESVRGNKENIIIITEQIIMDDDFISLRQLDEKFYYGRKKDGDSRV